MTDQDEVARLKQALRDCIEDLEDWGGLALSSDYSGPDDKEQLARDIDRHKSNLVEG